MKTQIQFYSELLHFLCHAKSVRAEKIEQIIKLAKQANPSIPGRFTASTIRALKRGESHPRFGEYKVIWERLQQGVRMDTEVKQDAWLRSGYGLLEVLSFGKISEIGTFLPTVKAA